MISIHTKGGPVNNEVHTLLLLLVTYGDQGQNKQGKLLNEEFYRLGCSTRKFVKKIVGTHRPTIQKLLFWP